MFNKKKQGRHRSSNRFDTLISARTTIEGDVRFSGGLHVDGKIKGRVIAEEGSDAVIRLSEVGQITGDVIAPHIIINGTVHGDVRSSSHLELAEKSSVNGSVYYQLIEMAMGAAVNGNLIRQTETTGLLSHEQPETVDPELESEGKSE